MTTNGLAAVRLDVTPGRRLLHTRTRTPYAIVGMAFDALTLNERIVLRCQDGDLYLFPPVALLDQFEDVDSPARDAQTAEVVPERVAVHKSESVGA